MTNELDRWAELDLTANLWLRDDDAIEITGALVQLTQLSATFHIPLLLAVIPQPAKAELHGLFDEHPLLSAAVHGYEHRNHAKTGQKSIELGGQRSDDQVCRELLASREKLKSVLAGKLTDILVPPWNRISEPVARRLPELGFNCVSTFGAAAEANDTKGLCQLNTHLDIIDWKGNRGGRDPDWLVKEFVKLLHEARDAGGTPVGILTHHLVHDEIAWMFLEELLALTARHPAVRWCGAQQLCHRKSVV